MENNVKITPTKYLFILSLIALGISIIPINQIGMYIGIGLASIALVGSILIKTKTESTKRELAIVFSIVAIASIVVWILFFQHILGTLY